MHSSLTKNNTVRKGPRHATRTCCHFVIVYPNLTYKIKTENDHKVIYNTNLGYPIIKIHVERIVFLVTCQSCKTNIAKRSEQFFFIKKLLSFIYSYCLSEQNAGL